MLQISTLDVEYCCFLVAMLWPVAKANESKSIVIFCLFFMFDFLSVGKNATIKTIIRLTFYSDCCYNRSLYYAIARYWVCCRIGDKWIIGIPSLQQIPENFMLTTTSAIK